MSKRSFIVALLLVAGIPAGVGRAAAVEPFGPDYLVSGSAPSGAAASISSSGVTRGFVARSVGGVGDGPISYFEAKDGSAPVEVRTPYTGRVQATAWNGVDAVYVAYTQGGSLNIAKRVISSKSFSPVTQLATGGTVSPFTTSFQADVVASAGGWWAVWSRPVNGTTGPNQLFQRHTLFTNEGVTRITHTTTSDSQPSLAYFGGAITLVWTRATTTASTGPSILRIGSSRGGAWHSVNLSHGGTRNSDADILDYNGTVFATWQTDGHIVEAENTTGIFTTHTFTTLGFSPRIGVSGSKVFLGWSTGVSPRPQEILFSERNRGVWTNLVLQNHTPGVVHTVLGQGGIARVLYSDAEVAHFQTQTHQ